MYLDGGNLRTSHALFGNVTYQFNRQWKAEGGVRETWDENTNPFKPCAANLNNASCYYGDANAFHFLGPNPNDPWGPLILNGNGRQNLGSESDSLFIWKLALDYNVTPQSYLYGEIATGAKSGGIRTNIPGDNFAPERDTDLEIGWKATGLGGRASIQLDAFYMSYSDMQIRAADIVSGQNSIYNAGHANDYGVELTAQSALSRWQFAATGSWVRSHFTLGNIVNQDACSLYAPCFNENAGQCPPGVPNGPVPGSPGSTCFNYRDGGAYINGQYFPWIESVNGLQLPNSATFQGNVSVSYAMAIRAGGTLTPRLDLSYQGRQFSQIYDTPLDLYPSRTNVTVKLTYDRTRWLLAAFATNLTGRVYPLAQNDQNAEIFSAPRQFGMQISYRW
jgi:iron complex outermembrane receptor protein